MGVDDRQCRPLGDTKSNSGVAVLGLADDEEVVIACQARGDAPPEHRMVVGDQRSDRRSELAASRSIHPHPSLVGPPRLRSVEYRWRAFAVTTGLSTGWG